METYQKDNTIETVKKFLHVVSFKPEDIKEAGLWHLVGRIDNIYYDCIRFGESDSRLRAFRKLLLEYRKPINEVLSKHNFEDGFREKKLNTLIKKQNEIPA